MSTPESSETSKVSLDELLRLKRAERPAPEFWTRFEQDLRAKQLAAIVEKRPWWVALRFPQVAQTVARWQLHLPAGAVAVLVLSFLVVREYRSNDFSALISAGTRMSALATSPQADAVTGAEHGASTESTLAGLTAVTPVSAPGNALVASAAPPALIVDVVVPSAKVLPIPNERVTINTRVVPQDILVADNNSAESGVGELLAVNFADATQPGAQELGFNERVELVGLSTKLGDAGGAEVRTIRAKPVSAYEVRRARILASWVVADHAADKGRIGSDYGQDVSTESVIDARGYTNAGRIGMGGDRLTLKF